MILELKCLVLFAGVAFNKTGGVTSFGPPWGLTWFAQPKKAKIGVSTNKNLTKNSDFLFNMVFMGYNRLLLFYED
jgi:hypothetical protein